MNDFLQIKEAIYKLLQLEETEWLDLETKLIQKNYSKNDFLTRQGQVEN